MKKMGVLCIILCFCCIFSVAVKAQQTTEEYTQEILTQQIEKLPFYDVDKQIEQIWKKTELPSFKDCVMNAVTECKLIDFKYLFSVFVQKLAGEITTQISMIKKILFIVLLSAILKNINTSFQLKSVGELGFYVCYMVLIVVITATF